MLIDVVPFFNEKEILKLRFEELYDIVDKFVIVENDHSFRGLYKGYNFEKLQDYFKPYLDKVEYVKCSLVGHEDLHKNYAMNSKTLQNLTNDDYVMFGDVDEIPKHDCVKYALSIIKYNYKTIIFDGSMYLYRLNGLVKDFVWSGTILFNSELLKNNTLTYIRDHIRPLNNHEHWHFNDSSWHFTTIGTYEQIFDKLTNWGHWSEIDNISLSVIKSLVEKGEHFHPNCKNLKIEYTNIEDLPKGVSQFDYLLKEF